MKRPSGGARHGAAAVALLAVLFGAVAGASGAASTKAELPRRVVLDVSACPDVPGSALRRIVAIEIGDLLVGDTETTSAETDRVLIACRGAAARVQADGPGHAQTLERTLRLDDFPGDAAPRALALAAIEILAVLSPDVRARIEAPKEPRPPPAPPAAVIVAPPAPAPPRPSPSVLCASAFHRAFLAGQGIAIWGGRLGARHEWGPLLELGVDGELGGGTASESLGRITSTLASGAVFLGVHAGGTHLTGAVDLGGRVGIVRWEGHPVEGSTVVGERVSHAWGGPMLAARVRGNLGSVGLEVGVELGFDLGRADGSADGATVVTVAGPWLALSTGIGLQF